MPITILLVTVEGGRRRARPHNSWRGNTKEWTGQSLSFTLRIADEQPKPWKTEASAVVLNYAQVNFT